jgi:hypothetical protein
MATTFGCALARAARRRISLEVLDWSGGNGHNFASVKALMTGIVIDYSVQEVPRLAEAGRHLLPWRQRYSCAGQIMIESIEITGASRN